MQYDNEDHEYGESMISDMIDDIRETLLILQVIDKNKLSGLLSDDEMFAIETAALVFDAYIPDDDPDFGVSND